MIEFLKGISSEVWLSLLALISLVVGKYWGEEKSQAKVRKLNYAADKMLADNYDRYTSKLEARLEVLEKEYVINREENETLKQTILTLQEEILFLRNKLLLVENNQLNLPIPIWLKDLDGKMLSLNQAFEDLFLLPNGLTTKDYLGKTDKEFWGEEKGKLYRQHDLEVLKTGELFNGIEKIKIADEEIEYRVVKFIRYSGKVKIGVGGIAIPLYKNTNKA